MGILDFVKKQFIDIIQWTEEGDEVLVWRFPMRDFEIQQGAQLTVRETQTAMFVHQGQVADLFGPGQHTIKTQNVPILTDLQHWDKMFESPFKSDVYFFPRASGSTRSGGTSNPITIRDKEFGAVRLRTFGIYAYKISDPKAFFTKVSGTREAYTVSDMEGQLRNTIVAVLTDHFAESGIPFLDMAANQVELSRAVGDKMKGSFGDFGLSLESFVVQNVSLPEELQKRLDERIGMGVVGDMGRYTQFQTAQAIPHRRGGRRRRGRGGRGSRRRHRDGPGHGPGARSGGPGRCGWGGWGRGSCRGGHGGMHQMREADRGGVEVLPRVRRPQTASCPKCKAKLDRPAKFCPECGTSIK